MAGGMKEVVFNTLEEVISPDLNRAQKFKGADIAELLRYWVDVSGGNDDADAGGVTTEHLSTETPLRAEIFNGFLVHPEIAGQRLSVDPGVLMAVAPDVAPDDSAYKYVRDPGSIISAGLVIATNGAVGRRLDVVGATIQFITSESDNRNFFDPTTGLFAPTTVPKASQATLAYSVVAGTPGGGFPTLPTGFIPLAVAYVPINSLNNDTVIFYDVRRLLNDRAYGAADLSNTVPFITRGDWFVDIITASPKAWMSGLVDVTYKGRRAGGFLQASAPFVTDALLATGGSGQLVGLDVTDPGNLDVGFTAPTNAAAAVYLAFPEGYSRFARYTGGPGVVNRLPRGPRGIPLVSNKFPTAGMSLDLNPGTGSTVNIPGLGVTSRAVMIGSVGYDGSSKPTPSQMSGRAVWLGNAFINLALSSHVAFTSAIWFLQVGGNTNPIPSAARSVFLRLRLIVQNTSGGNIVTGWATKTIDVLDVTGSNVLEHWTDGYITLGWVIGGTQSMDWTVEVPMPYLFPTSGGANGSGFRWSYNAASGLSGALMAISGTPTAQLLGYRL